jgi:hypothetical protein
VEEVLLQHHLLMEMPERNAPSNRDSNEIDDTLSWLLMGHKSPGRKAEGKMHVKRAVSSECFLGFSDMSMGNSSACEF